ncbi:MAG TPA: TolC family protein [bacterium]|nr:TolC family protein [bacterium]
MFRINKNTIRTFAATAALAACVAVASPAVSESSGRIELTVEQAVMTAIQNNGSLDVQKYDYRVTKLGEETQKSTFDLKMSDSLSTSGSKSSSSTKTDSLSNDFSVSKLLSSGAELEFGLSMDKSGSAAADNSYSTRFGVSLSKPLFKGAGSDVNLVGIRKAELNTEISRYELEDYVKELAASVESMYWDYALALRNIEIYEDSLELAKQQLEEAEKLVEVGRTAEIDLVAAKAEVALRESSLVSARGQLESLRLDFLRLLNPSESDYWDYEVVIKENLQMPETQPGVLDDHIETALSMRPDLKQARLSIDKNELEVVVTKNGLLPDLGLIVTAGRTGYDGSFGGSVTDIADDAYDVRLGLQYQYTFGRRSDKVQHSQAVLKKEQSEKALTNLELQVQRDIRESWVNMETAKQKVASAAASRVLQEEKLRAEVEKNRVGKSTSLLVATAQRDFLSSQIEEARSVAGYITSLTELYRLEGSLLDRYGISVFD